MEVLLIATKRDFEAEISGVTGIGRYARSVYEGLSKLVQVEKYPVFDYSSFLSSLITTLKANLTAAYPRYDIIHVLSPKIFFPLFKGKSKLVITVHDLFFLRYKESTTKFSQLYLKSISWANVVVVVSSLIKEDLSKFVYKEKIFVVNPGIEDRFFKEKTEKGRNNVIKTGYIGRIDHKRKNVLRAVRDFKRLKRKDVVLELWGSYDENSELFKEIAKEAREDSRIKIMGPLPDEKLISVYDSFDLFLLPSKEEGFGYPVIEAYSRGVPVIVYKDSRIPDEVCTYCVKVDELNDEDIEKALNTNRDVIREYASNFTIQRSGMQLVKVYEKLLLA
jgi:glycosyltransferase involved in cell wall biosynthesis